MANGYLPGSAYRYASADLNWIRRMAQFNQDKKERERIEAENEETIQDQKVKENQMLALNLGGQGVKAYDQAQRWDIQSIPDEDMSRYEYSPEFKDSNFLKRYITPSEKRLALKEGVGYRPDIDDKYISTDFDRYESTGTYGDLNEDLLKPDQRGPLDIIKENLGFTDKPDYNTKDLDEMVSDVFAEPTVGGEYIPQVDPGTSGYIPAEPVRPEVPLDEVGSEFYEPLSDYENFDEQTGEFVIEPVRPEVPLDDEVGSEFYDLDTPEDEVGGRSLGDMFSIAQGAKSAYDLFTTADFKSGRGVESWRDEYEDVASIYKGASALAGKELLGKTVGGKIIPGIGVGLDIYDTYKNWDLQSGRGIDSWKDEAQGGLKIAGGAMMATGFGAPVGAALYAAGTIWDWLD
tara:strand:- start:5932 stop:7143 length:1212 start_codon:yes stop_codon:yes gene_type:complete